MRHIRLQCCSCHCQLDRHCDAALLNSIHVIRRLSPKQAANYDVVMTFDDVTVLDALLAAGQRVQSAFAGASDPEGALRSAHEFLANALADHPDDARLLTALGAVACDRGQHEQALAPLRRALALGSRDKNAYFNLGVALINLSEPARAKTAFTQACALSALSCTWEAYFDPQAH